MEVRVGEVGGGGGGVGVTTETLCISTQCW